MGELTRRRDYSQEKLNQITKRLAKSEERSKNKACVYVTGSFGRLEASEHSDLDVFILGKNCPDGTEGRCLTRLDEICIKADLIETTRSLNIQEFSGDGLYLEHFSVRDLVRTLGTQNDDATNTFTARLLLLLESRPLLESGVYQALIDDVIAAYWRDYEDHQTDFMPAFLANDILRLWRTFCVNYEARTKRAPDIEKAKGKLKNYKLKHSRLLTCYSALLYLLATYNEQKTVSPSDVRCMIEKTPTERLEHLLNTDYVSKAHPAIRQLSAQYEIFLQKTNAPEQELIKRFLDRTSRSEYMSDANTFGDFVFDALKSIGSGTPFHRLLVV
jgi:predicted nucleotidyltransferase